MKLAIAKYYLSSGHPVGYSNEKNGITPDIEVIRENKIVENIGSSTATALVNK